MNNMINYLSAQCMLHIWNPALWDYFPNKKIAAQKKLFYRAMGIVQYDRALNGKQ